LACRDADPWAGGDLADPAVVTARSWSAIELAGQQIGVEERVEGVDDHEKPVRLRRRHYRFEVDGVPTELFAGGRTDADPLDIAGLTFRPLSERSPAWPRVDIVEILRRPSAPIENARRSRRGVYRLGDREIVVERPLRAELTAVTWSQLEALVMTTRDATDGDCKAHAATLLEIAYAQDLEARTVGGLVYIEGRFGTGFHPHAWSEVRADGMWLPVDAILDQPLADATHIPVTPRDVVSRLPLEVVDVR